ncbi:MAG: hypothetical protein WA459_03455 [Stellaceae bacterium]
MQSRKPSAICFAIYLALLSIGVGAVFAATTSTEFWIARICFVFSAILLAIAFFLWLLQDLRASAAGSGLRVLAGAFASLAIFGVTPAALYWIEAKENSIVSGNFFQTPMPGFSLGAVIRLLDTPALRRKFLFEALDPEGAAVSVYLTAEDKFLLSLKDIYGESYSVPVSLGSRGVPFGQFIFIMCEVGLADNKTGVGIFVNGKLVASQLFPVSLNIGSRNWKLTSFGADSHGNDPGAFQTTEFFVMTTSPGRNTRKKLWENINGYYNIYTKTNRK